MNHWFWATLMGAVVVWYSTITFYISFRGAYDIKEMLGNLDRIAKEEEEARKAQAPRAGGC